MSDEPQADLSLIARQQRQLLAEMGTIRDDITVLTAIVQRLGERDTCNAYADEPDGPARA